jgi:CRP-like cAMP-binding protein
MIECPRCGYQFDLWNYLTLQERRAADVILDSPFPLPTAQVAEVIGYCPRHTRRLLNSARRMGVIDRMGQRGPWYAPARELALVA